MTERKDGRPLVTEHAVTWQDRVDYIPAGEIELPASVLTCGYRREPVDESWMDPDDGPGDEFDVDQWPA